MVVDSGFAELINKEFWNLYFTLKLDITKDARKLLLPQTVAGRALEGHGGFNGIANPDTTLYDVVNSIHSFGKKSFPGLEEILAGRQKMVDDFENCLYALLEGKRNKLVDSSGDPLFGVNFLKNLDLNLKKETYQNKETFKGIVLAGRMDSHEWRQKTVEHYDGKGLDKEPLSIGSGKEYLVNIEKLMRGKLKEEYFLDMNKIRNNILDSDEFLPFLKTQTFSEKDIENYKQQGVIVDNAGEGIESVLLKIQRDMDIKFLSKRTHSENEIKNYKKQGLIVDKIGKGIESVFIRRKEGLGCCDDLSLMGIGVFHNPEAMILGFGVDAVDTYAKLIESPVQGGADEKIAEGVYDWWLNKYDEPLVTPEECMRIIYFGAKNNYPKIGQHSSSHRRFTQRESLQNSNLYAKNPTFIEHINFLKSGGVFPPPHALGFSRIPNRDLYYTVVKRLQSMGEGALLSEWGQGKTPRKKYNPKKKQ